MPMPTDLAAHSRASAASFNSAREDMILLRSDLREHTALDKEKFETLDGRMGGLDDRIGECKSEVKTGLAELRAEVKEAMKDLAGEMKLIRYAGWGVAFTLLMLLVKSVAHL